MSDSLPDSVTRPLYLLWLAQSGPGMTAAEIDYVAVTKYPAERDWNASASRGFGSFSFESLFPVSGPSASEYLERAGFIVPEALDRFRISKQGIALVTGVSRQPAAANSVFKLDPAAPLDYIGLLSELDSLENPLIVDPYFHPHDLDTVLDAMPKVRLITTPKQVAAVEAFQKPKLNASLKKGQFEEVLGSRRAGETGAEVIYVPATELHDRYFLGSNSKGYLAGGSFRSDKPTVVIELEPDHASELYRRYSTVASDDKAEKLEPRATREKSENIAS